MRVYSPYQDYYEVVPPNAHETAYVRSYYGPPYAGKSPALPCPCLYPQPRSVSRDQPPTPTPPLLVTTYFPKGTLCKAFPIP